MRKRALLAEASSLLLVGYLVAPMFLEPDLGEHFAAPMRLESILGDYLAAGWGEYFATPLTGILPGSRFGVRWHPTLKVRRFHAGLDYPAPAGTPVRATRAGVVVFRGVDGRYGRLVRITHDKGYETRYAHLKKWSPGLHVGITVRTGQIIGYVGESGQATGPHLHYEVRLFGRPLDPENP